MQKQIKAAYRQWCSQTFPDYTARDFPCRGRMFEVWCAAWTAAYDNMKGESK